ncbi:MAG: PIN domain-containing protein [Verrucomicrobia bacterium]|nr:PIN domain-containing protein [Verrucomicrobiota bacterium]MCH8513476.1 PIN domain-containing protein [Kiritimatiellia bacterium]
MIAVDTNLLVYALREDAVFHEQALDVLVRLAESGRRWAIPWPCAHEFLAIGTHPKIYRPSTPVEIACEAMRVWLSSPFCETLSEGPGYWEKLQQLVRKANVKGGMIHDARIAAICIHHGVSELWTADRDFSRFPELKTRNPML